MLETYETCEDMMRVLSGFRDRLKEVNDSAVENYVDKADSYISNLWLIAKDISDYIDDGKMSDLSDAKRRNRPSFQPIRLEYWMLGANTYLLLD